MVIAAPLAECIRRIEALARRDSGNRGLASFADSRDLLSAASELASAERVILVTGFCIRAAMAGETDGPSGTLALADALHQLGKEVVLVTDEYSHPLLTAGAAVFGTAFPSVTLSLVQEEADRQIESILNSYSPTHVVAIERPGSAADGHRYSMRGEIMDDIAPAADRLLAPLSPRRFTTIAIGDGGNELGFGSLRDTLKARVLHGDLIFLYHSGGLRHPGGDFELGRDRPHRRAFSAEWPSSGAAACTRACRTRGHPRGGAQSTGARASTNFRWMGIPGTTTQVPSPIFMRRHRQPSRRQRKGRAHTYYRARFVRSPVLYRDSLTMRPHAGCAGRALGG